MTELKTLKDIDGEDEYTEDNVHTGFWVSRSELKQEAIKWIKDKNYYGDKNHNNWKWIFLNFFNITEEELKDG